jgi:chemotaxis signal transduction protein
MIDLIVFRIGTNKYAINIENIQRIIQAVALTNIPNANKFIDGMMSHEEKVIKVLNFRKLIGMQSYDDELAVLFIKLKGAHGAWVESLQIAVNTKSEFTKTTNPHMCELGKWIDSFTSYDDSIAAIFNDLVENHKQLHHKGQDILDINQIDEKLAKKMLDTDINNIYVKTMGALDTFVKELETIANSLQKLIIYEQGKKIFAIKVDEIEDIVHADESSIKSASEDDGDNQFLELKGVLELNGALINMIKKVDIPR